MDCYCSIGGPEQVASEVLVPPVQVASEVLVPPEQVASEVLLPLTKLPMRF